MICVDASLAAKWILVENDSEKALALVQTCAQQNERMLAPPLLPIEVTNILRQRMRKAPADPDRLDLQRAVQLLKQFLSFPVELVSPEGLHERALELATTYNLPAVYDAHYLALAEFAGCSLWTADERFWAAVGGKLSFVKRISDYSQQVQAP